MSLRITQEATAMGSQWWRWSVWLEGDPEELDSVVAVEYTLHPTFPQPVVLIRDRGTNFRLDESGWGEFMIHASVKRKDGSSASLRHWLKLAPSAPIRAASPTAPATYYLSSSIADEPFADAIQESLEQKGAKVLRAESDPELPPEVSLERTLQKADAAVLIVSDKHNPWMRSELRAIRQRAMPVIPVVIVSGRERLPEELRQLQQVRVKELKPGAVEPDAAAHVAQEILKLPR